jgi:hypothetical protein
MKILAESTYLSSSLTSGSAASGFALSNIETNQPQERFSSTSASVTIRVNVSGASDSFFLDGWHFVSGSYSLDGGAAVNFSAAQLENRFEFKPWGVNLSKRRKPIYVSGLSFSSTLDLTLNTDRTTTAGNFQNQQLEGNAISLFKTFNDGTYTPTTKGRFLDSATNVVDLINHGYVLPNTLIELSYFGPKFERTIVAIEGSGLSTDSVEVNSLVSQNFAFYSVSKIAPPISLGILRVGNSRDFANPQSLSRNYEDFSTVRTGTSGFRQVTKRGIAQTINAQGIYTQAQADGLIGIAAAKRGEPVPIQITESMTTERDLQAVFGGITIPTDAYATPTGTYRNLNYLISEVL